jgi:DNA-binding MarR family transcriptional regulator
MHAVIFSIKRAFHTSTWNLRRRLKNYRLTPSRFDILHVLDKRGGFVLQSVLRRILGVTAPTVSVMVRAIAKLGFLRCQPGVIDERQVVITITEMGRDVYKRVVRDLIKPGIIAQLVRRCVSHEPNNPDVWFPDLDAFDTTLTRMKRHLKDKSTLLYPWHPDD